MRGFVGITQKDTFFDNTSCGSHEEAEPSSSSLVAEECRLNGHRKIPPLAVIVVDSWPPASLRQNAWSIYVAFRPETGWGQKAKVPLAAILDQRCGEQELEAGAPASADQILIDDLFVKEEGIDHQSCVETVPPTDSSRSPTSGSKRVKTE